MANIYMKRNSHQHQEWNSAPQEPIYKDVINTLSDAWPWPISLKRQTVSILGVCPVNTTMLSSAATLLHCLHLPSLLLYYHLIVRKLYMHSCSLLVVYLRHCRGSCELRDSLSEGWWVPTEPGRSAPWLRLGTDILRCISWLVGSVAPSKCVFGQKARQIEVERSQQSVIHFVLCLKLRPLESSVVFCLPCSDCIKG